MGTLGREEGAQGPMHRKHNEGFTLMEVGLAITLGLIMTSTMAVYYYQVKDDAGDAQMKLRVGSLKSAVETLYTAQGSCPSITDVRAAWKAKRPDDYKKSPWGGDIYTTDTDSAWEGIGPSAAGSDLAAGTVIPWSSELNMTSGGLYYYRITDSVNGTVMPSMLASASLWDQARKAQVTIIGYGVAGLKSANKHYMVTSGR